ncbi:MAG: NAD-dependent epimerase [Bacteroidales bacterium]
MEKILITGTAGFIGFHLANRLVDHSFEVIGLDNINTYYDVALKHARLEEAGIDTVNLEYGKITRSSRNPAYRFIKLDLKDRESILKLFEQQRFDRVVHLAAQAGVRYSLKNPQTYIDSNITGFLNILEACRHYPVKHLLYASSSSVYGSNTKQPFSEADRVDTPVSLYAVSKKSNELMAHSYSHLFGIPATGLRFFTVYGPWGRPDMAAFLFTERILDGRPIEVYNQGNMKRDFTYIDDIVKGVEALLGKVPPGRPPFRILNIGNSRPVDLMHFIRTLEEKLETEARKEFLPLQPGDVPETFADTTHLHDVCGYKPSTSVEEGISRFVDWYRSFYRR